MVLDLELRAEFCDHGITKIGTIIRDNPFRDTIPTDEVMFNEPGHNNLGNGGK